MSKPADAIFEGGGVKALGLLGALDEAERRGYAWMNVAGSSAGAIIASFVSAGYTAVEIMEMVWSTDFRQFRDETRVGRLSNLGPAMSLWFEQGLYEGKALENWLQEKLAAKGVHTFGDLVLEEYKNDPLRRYKLVVVASDISRRKLLRLPYDIEYYNIKPDNLEVFKAVRMSASLPFFYKPCKVVWETGKGQENTSYILDGGVLSNFPVWIFDGTDEPTWPSFGFKTVAAGEKDPATPINNPFDLFKAILSTMMEAHDKLHELDPKSRVRTISVPTQGVKTTDFDLNKELKEALVESGVKAARAFFDGWDFESFKAHYLRS